MVSPTSPRGGEENRHLDTVAWKQPGSSIGSPGMSPVTPQSAADHNIFHCQCVATGGAGASLGCCKGKEAPTWAAGLRGCFYTIRKCYPISAIRKMCWREP